VRNLSINPQPNIEQISEGLSDKSLVDPVTTKGKYSLIEIMIYPNAGFVKFFGQSFTRHTYMWPNFQVYKSFGNILELKMSLTTFQL
jgi:hypothetical protein